MEVMAKKLDRFGWERDRNSYAHDRMVIDWMDALQDYPLGEVREACRTAVRDNPNKMPNEGHIVAAILAARKAEVAHLPKPENYEQRPDRVSKEAAREIMEKAGFRVNRMAKE